VSFTGGFYGSAPANDTYPSFNLSLKPNKTIHSTAEVGGLSGEV